MSVVARPPQPELLTESGGIRNWLGSPAFPLLIGTLGCLPLLIVHFQQMWARPHYQFFPLVLLAVGILYQVRRSDPPSEIVSDRPLVSGVSLICGFLLAGFAVLRISPLLGWAAWLVICLSTVFRARRNHWAAWGLLCLLLRLPQGKDVWLIQTLQRLTTGIASTVLDQLQIDHIREGNVLAFPSSHKLLVEEACSGIVSLFMIIATAAILGAVLRRTFLHTILLMVAGGFWASAANILRVVAIAYSLEKIGLDLTEGWAHDALGMVIFIVTLVMLLSTDSLLRFSFGPIEIDETGAPEPIHENWLVMLWNKLFWPQHERPESVSSIPPLPSTLSQPAGGWLALVFVIALGFMGLGGLQVWGGIGPFSRSLGISARVGELSLNSLPEELAGWKRIEFRDVERRATSEFGERSRQWTFSRDNITATISLDYPFPEWHGLDNCYRGVGWQTRQDPAFQDSGTALQFTLINEYQKGHLIYDMFDQLGQPYVPPIDTGVHPRWSRLWSGDVTPWTLPTYYQIQVLCTREILEKDHRSLRPELQQLFLAARSHLFQAMIPAPLPTGETP